MQLSTGSLMILMSFTSFFIFVLNRRKVISKKSSSNDVDLISNQKNYFTFADLQLFS